MPQSSVIPTLHAQSSSRPNKSKSRRHPNTKRTGELAEAAFIVKAAGLGYAVSKPWGDSERYDFILDTGRRTFRVQVKSTESPSANGYEVQSTYTDRKRKGHYTAADIDVLVAYILPLDLWYVVPVAALPASASLRFYPEGNISGRHPRFEQYRDAWHLFDARVGRAPSPAISYECHPERSEGSAVLSSGGTVLKNDCHAERSGASEAEHHEVEAPLPHQGCHPQPQRSEGEGPAVGGSEKAPDPVPTPASPMERMMTQWAQRVNTLYRKR